MTEREVTYSSRTERNLDLLARCIMIKESGREIFTASALYELMQRETEEQLGACPDNEDSVFRYWQKFISMTERELQESANRAMRETSLPFSDTLPVLALAEQYDKVGEVLIDPFNMQTENLTALFRAKPKTHFTIIHQALRHRIIYRYLYEAFPNVTVRDADIALPEGSYDRILWGSAFVFQTIRKVGQNQEPFREATQHLLTCLKSGGQLQIVLGAAVMPSRRNALHFQELLQRGRIHSAQLLETPTPGDAVTRMAFWGLGESRKDSIEVSHILFPQLNADTKPKILHRADMTAAEYAEQVGADIDAYYSERKIAESALKKASCPTEKLCEVADVFRGKNITDYSLYGNIAVLNIADLLENGIDYARMRKIEENERVVASYLLEDGDVILTARGTTSKIAVFQQQSMPVIAASNLLVIRPMKDRMNGLYLKLFLESETGSLLLQSVQRGTTLIQISAKDLKNIEVPVPQIEKQNAIADAYTQGLSEYLHRIAYAAQEWQERKKQIESQLV